MRLRLATAVILLAAASLVGCGSDPAINADGSPTTVAAPVDGPDYMDLTAEDAPEVDAVDNNFRAPYVKVNAGTPITFRNEGRNDHNVIPVDDRAFAPVETDAFTPGAETTITFDQPGDYPYYCSLHGTETAGMIGGVSVVDE